MQIQFIATEIDATITGEVRFLQASGEKHKAIERRVQLGAAPSRVAFESTSSRATPRSSSTSCPTAAAA